MNKQEESANKKPLIRDQIDELMTNPSYWRDTLRKAAERGVNKRNLRGVKRLGVFDVNVIAE